jgi:hypothetical protein
MTGDSDAVFYHSNTGYAQARYLCFYLQEKGLLHRYYDGSSAGVAADPTGYKTLVRVLGNPKHGEVGEGLAAVGAGPRGRLTDAGRAVGQSEGSRRTNCPTGSWREDRPPGQSPVSS